MNLEYAKVFCKMSFEPHIFPCVCTYSASQIYNALTFDDSAEEDFDKILLEYFGAETYAGNHLFRICRTDFYKQADRALKIHDGKALNKLFTQLFETTKACKAFGGGDNVEIFSRRQEDNEFDAGRQQP